MILKRVTEKHVNNEVEKNKNTQAIPGANHMDSDKILFQPRVDDVLDGYHTRQRQRRPRLLPFARTMIQNSIRDARFPIGHGHAWSSR